MKAAVAAAASVSQAKSRGRRRQTLISGIENLRRFEESHYSD